MKKFNCYLTKSVTDMGKKDLLMGGSGKHSRLHYGMHSWPWIHWGSKNFEKVLWARSFYCQCLVTYVSKIVNGPSIKVNDCNLLSGLSHNMRNCLIACRDLSSASLGTKQIASSICCDTYKINSWPLLPHILSRTTKYFCYIGRIHWAQSADRFQFFFVHLSFTIISFAKY